MRNTAHKRGGWKAASNRTKLQKKTRLAVLVLFLIVFIILMGNLFRFTQNLFQPISQTVKKEYSWDGQSRINLVVKSNEVSLLSFDPEVKEVVIAEIPPETYVDVPGGYDSWQIRAVYDLGQSENPPKGARLLRESVGLLLGLPIDGYLQVNDKSTQEMVDDLRAPLKIMELTSLKTDLTPIELLKLEYGLSQVRFDKVKIHNLSDLEILSQEDIAGSKALIADPLRLDGFVVKNFFDSQIRDEQKTIAIFNATDTPGLAAKAARIITNLGGNVIIQTNSATKLEKTVVVGDDSFTKKRLGQVFCEKGICDKIAPSGFDFRAQLNVVLGQDFASK